MTIWCRIALVHDMEYMGKKTWPPTARVINMFIIYMVVDIKASIKVVDIKITDLPVTTERISSYKYILFRKYGGSYLSLSYF
jgi:hypothetical protein